MGDTKRWPDNTKRISHQIKCEIFDVRSKTNMNASNGLDTGTKRMMKRTKTEKSLNRDQSLLRKAVLFGSIVH